MRRQTRKPPDVASHKRQPPQPAKGAEVGAAHLLEAALGLQAADAARGHVHQLQSEALHAQAGIAAQLQEVVEISGEAEAEGVTGQAAANTGAEQGGLMGRGGAEQQGAPVGSAAKQAGGMEGAGSAQVAGGGIGITAAANE